MGMLFDVDSYTNLGDRECNEDSVYLGENGTGERLFIVADGLGGHGGGDIASDIVVKTLAKRFRNGGFDIKEAIDTANADILVFQKEAMKKCKSTIAAVYIKDDELIAAHVGDSRIYAFADGQIVYQSQDHSASQLAVTLGEITPDQIRGHSDRNILTKALGAAESVKADIDSIPAADIDAVLLCTDGFWECVTEDDMLFALSTTESAGDWLVKMIAVQRNAAVNGDKDNNSAVVLRKGDVR